MTLLRCKSCVYPTSKPDLHFIGGECSACINARNKPRIDWADRYRQLIDIISRTPPNKDGFDCIVPSSGGKDSTAQVLMLKELGANPLVVTATTCHLTPMGRANIDNLARYAKTIEYDPDFETRRTLNKLGLELVGDISWPEHAAIFSVPFRAALEHDIPLVFYGECPQREYGGPIDSHEALTMTRRWVSEYGGMLGLRPDDFVGMDGIASSDMDYYRLPESDEVEAYFLGQFVPWSSRGNAARAVGAGMTFALPSQANWWEWENLDNAQTGLHDHAMFRKYGYGRLAGQVCVDIRQGILTREEGMKVVRERDGIFPEVYAGVPIKDVLDRLGVSREWLIEQLCNHTSWDLFDRVEGDRPILLDWEMMAAE